jgi:hypothetical protein
VEYARLCNGLNSIGVLIPVKESVYKHIKNHKDRDYYKSVYFYNEDQKAHADELIEKKDKNGEPFTGQRGVGGITDVFTNILVFDFDSENDQEAARQDTIVLVEKLVKAGIPEEGIEIAFSGNKGFSVKIQTESRFNPRELKNIVINLAGVLQTLDNKIYNASRIFRVTLTKHQETGLYKYPLTFDDLKDASMDEIKELAQDISGIDPIDYEKRFKKVKLPKTVESLKDVSTEIEIPKVSLIETLPEAVITPEFLAKRPRHMDAPRWALQNGFFQEGERNQAFLCLAATYKNFGYEASHTINLLKGVAEIQAARHNCEPYPEDELAVNIVNQVYGPNWKGGQFSYRDKNSWLYDYTKKYGISVDSYGTEETTVKVDDGFASFVNYAENIEKNSLQFGIPSLDKKLKAKVGHLIGMLAPPGVGKTSFSITILNNTSLMGINSLFLSYDMYKSIVFQKLIQRETGLQEEEVFNAFKTRDTAKIEHFRKLLLQNYANVEFCFKTGQTIQQIKQTIIDAEKTLQEPIKLVVLDYSELVLSDFSDPTQRSAETIQGLREICNEMNKCVIVLLQPNKMSSKPNEALLTYNCAKGSSAIAQACTSMITAHRPGSSSLTPENDRFFSINCVKNRMGQLFALDFTWDGLTGKIGELEDYERQSLKDLRDQVKAEKAAEASKDNW